MKTKQLVLLLAIGGLLTQPDDSRSAILAKDDFEPGIDTSQWVEFGGTVLATNYGGSVSGANSLWFGGDPPHFAATPPLDTRDGGRIEFALRIADGERYVDTMWLRPGLPGEGVVLEYYFAECLGAPLAGNYLVCHGYVNQP